MTSPVSSALSLSVSLNASFQETYGKTITSVRTFQFSENQKTLLKTIAKIAVRILSVFVFVFMGTLFPFSFFFPPSIFLPGIAVGASVLTSFFFRNGEETPPPVFKRLPPLLPNLAKKPAPLEELTLKTDSIGRCPVGLYVSGMNSSFNAMVHYLDSDPQLADSLRRFGPLSKFFEAYDRAHVENRWIADANVQSIRYGLSQINPSISASESVQQEPVEILQAVLGSLQNRHLIEYEKTICQEPSPIHRKKEKVWGFELEINGSEPKLKEMFQDQMIKKTKNRKRTEEIVFIEAPSSLRFQIKRFEPELDGIVNRVLRLPSKNDAPVDIPPELEIRLQNGSMQKYRLTSLVNCEGTSFGNSRFIAGRIVDGQRYVVDGYQVIPVDRRVWEEQIVPQAYLLLYLPVDPQP